MKPEPMSCINRQLYTWMLHTCMCWHTLGVKEGNAVDSTRGAERETAHIQCTAHIGKAGSHWTCHASAH